MGWDRPDIPPLVVEGRASTDWLNRTGANLTAANLFRMPNTPDPRDYLQATRVTLDQAYDALGRRITLAANIDGTGDLINQYEYDYLNRMTQVTQSGQTGGNVVAEKRVDFAYDPLNDYRYESITRYADLAGTKMVAATQYDYDANSRLVALTHRDSLSATLAGYTWAYDHAGRLTDFTVAGYSGENATYTYDDTDQLIGVDRDGTANDESYTYDENGNRIGGGYTVGDNNQLLSDGTFNYTYDAEGNRLTKTEIATSYVTEYEWDYRNRLTAIIQKDDLGVVLHEVQYTYDIFNHRIVKTIDADGAGIGDPIQEIYIYDGLRQQRGNAGDHILLAFDEEGDLAHRYLHGPNVDQILAAEEISDPEIEGDVLWALTDHLGSVRDLAEYDDGLDTTTVVNHITYDAFGNITSETNAAVDFLFGFTGRERDTENDLQFNRARYYDAAIGRWISEDPIGFDAGDGNLVRYVGNFSTQMIDASGLVEVAMEVETNKDIPIEKVPLFQDPRTNINTQLGFNVLGFMDPYNWSRQIDYKTEDHCGSLVLVGDITVKYKIQLTIYVLDWRNIPAKPAGLLGNFKRMQNDVIKHEKVHAGHAERFARELNLALQGENFSFKDPRPLQFRTPAEREQMEEVLRRAVEKHIGEKADELFKKHHKTFLFKTSDAGKKFHNTPAGQIKVEDYLPPISN